MKGFNYIKASTDCKSALTRSKKFILLLLLLFGLYNSFAQTKPSIRDTLNNHLDTLVKKYEMEGLRFYNVAKYDSAIKSYKRASTLIDSILKIKERRVDFIISIITRCNIGICYCKMKNFYNGFKYLPDETINHNSWIEFIPKYQSMDDAIEVEILRLEAFIQYTYGDCKLMMGQVEEALSYYSPAHGNLKESKFPDSNVLKYPYGIKSYAYTSIYIELGDYYTKKADTANANLYYRKALDKQ